MIAGLLSVGYAAVVIQAQFAVIGGLVLIISGAYIGDGPLTRACAQPLPHYLGEISFSLYLVHIPVLLVGGHVANGVGGARDGAFCLIALGVAVVLAIILYEHVEVPARRALRSRLGLGAPGGIRSSEVGAPLQRPNRLGLIGDRLL